MFRRFLNPLRIKIERQTNIVALAALFLSISSVLYQIIDFLRGAEISLFTPRQIILLAYEPPGNDQKYLSIITSLSYANRASPGYNSVVWREDVEFTIKKRALVYTWHQFGTTLQTDDGRIEFTPEQSVNPFVVNAASATSHETFFWPEYTEKGISSKDFISAVYEQMPRGNAQNPRIKFNFTAETLNDGPKSTSCSVEITPDNIAGFEENGWMALRCNSETTRRT